MQYISVQLIVLLEAGVYNFSQGMSKTLMRFQFFFAVFLAMSSKFERAYMMYVQAYVMCKKSIIFYMNILLRRSEGSSRELIHCFE